MCKLRGVQGQLRGDTEGRIIADDVDVFLMFLRPLVDGRNGEIVWKLGFAFLGIKRSFVVEVPSERNAHQFRQNWHRLGLQLLAAVQEFRHDAVPRPRACLISATVSYVTASHLLASQAPIGNCGMDLARVQLPLVLIVISSRRDHYG